MAYPLCHRAPHMTREMLYAARNLDVRAANLEAEAARLRLEAKLLRENAFRKETHVQPLPQG